MSEPPPTEPPTDKDKPAPGQDGADKDNKKSLKDFVPPTDKDTPPPSEDKEVVDPAEFKALQKRLITNERKQLIEKIHAIDPDLAKKYKSQPISKLETILETAEELKPKFPVKRDMTVTESNPTGKVGSYLDRRTGKWVG